MSEDVLLNVVGVALGSGVMAEVTRRIIPGTKYDSVVVNILGMISKILTVGLTSFLKGDGRLKPQ